MSHTETELVTTTDATGGRRSGSRTPFGTSGKNTASGRVKNRLTNKWATLAALIIAILWTLPTLGLFISSIRPAADINRTGWWTWFANPAVTLDNYTQVLEAGNSQLNMAGAFLNSIAITIPATLIPLVIASLAAYAFAWIDFKGRNILFIAVFALQIVPLQMALVPAMIATKEPFLPLNFLLVKIV